MFQYVHSVNSNNRTSKVKERVVSKEREKKGRKGRRGAGAKSR